MSSISLTPVDTQITQRVRAAATKIDGTTGNAASHLTTIDRTIREYDHLAAAAQEAKDIVDSATGELYLTGDGLTPAMQALTTTVRSKFAEWRDDVVMQRDGLNAAIARLQAEEKRLLNFSNAKIDDLLNHEKKTRRDNLNKEPRFVREKDDADNYTNRYQTLLTYNDSEPPAKRSVYMYWLTLFGISAIEAIANYGSFLSLLPPVAAIFAAAVVLVVVATASHIHGKHFKQRQYLYVARLEANAYRWEKLLWYFLTLALLVALAFLLYARLTEFMVDAGFKAADWVTAINGGLLVSGLRAAWPVMLLNLGLWFVGMLYSALWYERVPGLREAYRDSLELQEAVREREKNLNDEVELMRPGVAAEQQATRIRANAVAQLTQAATAARDRANGQLQNSDRQISDRIKIWLNQYLGHLTDAIRDAGADDSNFAFKRADGTRVTIAELRQLIAAMKV